MTSLKLAHLYPDMMNLYGDRGNITVLKKRCQWRDISLTVDEIKTGREMADDYDLLFIGGGQDREQMLVYRDLLEKRERLRKMIDSGAVILAICGGYQLLGHRFLTYQGEEIEGLGLLDATTVGGTQRLIGNVICKTRLTGRPEILIGFENHSGRTTLGPNAEPLGVVEIGFGNNGRDRTEGARQKNIFGTYLHGSLLPKNPWLADYLLQSALKRKYGDEVEIEPIDDSIETAAREVVANRVRALRRRRWVPAWFTR